MPLLRQDVARLPPPVGGRGERTMNIPQEFEDVFRGVELTEDEIRTFDAPFMRTSLRIKFCSEGQRREDEHEQ